LAPSLEKIRQAGEKYIESYVRQRLAAVYLSSGNTAMALEQCRKAAAIARELDDLYLLRVSFCAGPGLFAIGQVREAEAVAAELEAVNARGMRKDVDIRICDHLRAGSS